MMQAIERKSPNKPSKPLMKMIKKQIYSPSNNYVIRPQSIFRSPLSRILSDEFKERDQKKMEITTHCNYGFNYDTIKVYASILDRVTKAYEILESQKMYNSEESGLFRLNDGIPLQFGGFSPCLNSNLLNISPTDDFQNGNSLFQYFIEICYNINPLTSYPLLQFVTNIYKEGDLKTISQFISGKIQKYFKECIEIIRQRNKNLGIEEERMGIGLPTEFEENFYQLLFAQLAISKQKNEEQTPLGKESSSNSIKIQQEPSFIGKRTRSDSEMEQEQDIITKVFKDDNRTDHIITQTKDLEEKKDRKKSKKKRSDSDSQDSEVQQPRKRKKDRKKDHKRKIKKDSHKKRQKDISKKNKHKKEKSKRKYSKK